MEQVNIFFTFWEIYKNAGPDCREHLNLLLKCELSQTKWR